MSDDSITNVPAGRRPWLPMLALAALLGGVFFFRLGQDLPLRTHEALVAETARNMLLGRPATLDDGSQPSPWLVPNFNGGARLRKTPLEYWLVAGLSSLTGKVDEWTARLPSAAAAAGTVLIVVALMRRRRRVGGLCATARTGREESPVASAFAGAMLATTAGFLIMARSALADMTMTFFCTASLAALWMVAAATGRRRFAWLVLAGAAAGLAMLAKGPAPALVLAAPYAAAAGIIITRLIRQRRNTTPLSPRGRGAGGEGADLAWTIAGALAAGAVFLAITLPWPLAVYAHVPDALRIWKAESLDRSTGDFGHEEPIYFYVIRLPALLLPWTVFFAYGVVLAILRWRSEAAERAWLLFLGAWLAGPLIAFSLAAGKQDHYILPILPAAGIYTAMAMGHMLETATEATRRLARRLVAGHAVAIAAFGVLIIVAATTCTSLRFLVFGFYGTDYPHEDLRGLPLAIALALGGWLSYRLAGRRPGWSMSIVLTMTALTFMWAWPMVIGPMDRSNNAVEFAEEVRRIVPPDQNLYAHPDANHTLVFYLDRRVQSLARARDVQAAIARGQPFYVICDAKHFRSLAAVPELWCIHDKRDHNNPEEGFFLWVWPRPPGPVYYIDRLY